MPWPSWPGTLRDLYQAALDEHWDTSTYEQVLAQEGLDSARFQDALNSIEEDDL